MSKNLYQGLRSRQILSILKKDGNQIDASTVRVTDSGTRAKSLNFEDKSEFMSFTEYPKLPTFKSLSLSNLTVDIRTSQIIKRRESSLPPSTTFKIPYGQETSCHSESPSIIINTVNTDFVNSQVASTSRNISAENTSDDSDVYANSSTSYKPSSSSSIDDDNNETYKSSMAIQNIFFGDLDEGRKRKKVKNMNEWKKIKNKKLRMEGKEYLGYTKSKGSKMEHNKIRSQRKLGKRCKSKFCEKSQNRKCNEISDDSRQLIFDYFWNNLNWDQRKVYITGLVNRTNVSRKTSTDESRREGSLHYFLPIDSNSNNKLQVCRSMFLNTFCLGSFTVQSWIKKTTFGMTPCRDVQNDSRSRAIRRGVERKMLTLNTFLDNIPKLPSHYRRKETTKLYLEPSFFSMTDLFKSYKKYCTDNEEPMVCRFTFEKGFKDKNLSLYVLKKDMCDICAGHAVGNINTEEYVAHINSKNRARRAKDEDKLRAARGEIILLTMDLEAVKVCPYLTASALYFKTKLTCHNFTIYNLISHHTVCYWFVETAADLTASTFASFVVDYLERFCLNSGLPIVIFSDGCTYQNRNNILSNALIELSIKHNIHIEQKFLEPGHTQMECDTVHSAIERKLKNREIYLPSDYIRVTKEARTHPSPYEVVDVDYSFIKNYADSSTFRYTTIRPGRKAGDPTVTKIRAIKYAEENIKIKLNFDEEWGDLPTRPKHIQGLITYSQMNNNPLPNSITKFNHLQSLKTVIPSDCHIYYDTLPKI